MTHSTKFIRCFTLICCLTLRGSNHIFGEEGEWKTAYFKRGFVGMFDGKGDAGIGGTYRMRTPLQYSGSKVRVFVRGGFEEHVELTKMALIQGADDQGKIQGKPFPILFHGTAGLKIEKGLKTAVSDVMLFAVTRGTWYVEDQYASPKFPYAYEVDQGYCEPGDCFEKEMLRKKIGARTGVAHRIDVFTDDPRHSILCFGDSITHGAGSTPNADQRYPAILAKLLDRPVLNLGQNSDLVQYAGAHEFRDLPGVDTVVFLMGINDIVQGGKMNSVAEYAKIVKPMIESCHQQKKKIFIGTITPASGIAQFDKDPGKETLRQAINTWIKQGNGADGVIDFDAALADPENPAKLRADCQVDWIHPNDRGYQLMAATAAKVLKDQ